MMGYFKFDNFHVKNDVATFLAILGENWATFYSVIWSH